MWQLRTLCISSQRRRHLASDANTLVGSAGGLMLRNRIGVFKLCAPKIMGVVTWAGSTGNAKLVIRTIRIIRTYIFKQLSF